MPRIALAMDLSTWSGYLTNFTLEAASDRGYEYTVVSFLW